MRARSLAPRLCMTRLRSSATADSTLFCIRIRGSGFPVPLCRILKSGAEKARVERQRCGFRWEQIGPAEAGIALLGVAAGGSRHRPEASPKRLTSIRAKDEVR